MAPQTFPGSFPPAGGGKAIACYTKLVIYFVYAIYNQKHNKFYIGQTFDIAKRIEEHNKKVLKGYTSRFDGTWILIYKEELSSRKEALDREKQLKSFRGREFIKKHIPVIS